MESGSFTYTRRHYKKIPKQKINKKPNFHNTKTEKSNCYKFQRNFLVIFLITIIFCVFSFYYIKIYKSKKIKSQDSIISSLKNEIQSLKLKLTQTEILLQNEKQREPLSEFSKLLSSINNLKNKVQNPKSFTETGILISFLTSPRSVIGKKKIRVGNKGDGGYVLLNDFENIKIAYSLGISNMIEFDKDLARRGIDVYMYDHTINRINSNDPKLHWFKKGICSSDTRNYNLMTLNEMLEQNGHLNDNNILLKIDVEGPEWEAFYELPEEFFKRFKYIIGEFHWFKNNIMREGKSEIILSVLKKLNKNHQVFHKHCHNIREAFTLGEYYFSDNIELSYIRKDNNTFENDYSIYPLDGLDYSDFPSIREKQIFLGMAGLFGFE